MKYFSAVVFSLLLLLLSASWVSIGYAAEYTVEVGEDSVQVSMAVGFQHNFTLFDPGIVIPPVSGSFSPQNSSGVVDAIASAIKSRVPDVSVEDLNMQVSFEPWSDVAKVQNLSVKASFRLVGPVRSQSGVLLVDMAWKAFIVTEDLLLAGVSINRVGEHYLADPVQRVASSQPPTGLGSLRIHWEGLLVPPNRVREVVSRINTLDFSKLQIPIAEWSNSIDLNGPSTVFRLDTGTRAVLAVRLSIPEPGQEIEIPYLLLTKLDGEVKSTGFATPQGDVLTVDLDAGSPSLVMSLVIGASVILLFASHFIDGRLTGRRRLRTRKGS